jgi:opacity protein-like surface antigen
MFSQAKSHWGTGPNDGLPCVEGTKIWPRTSHLLFHLFTDYGHKLQNKPMKNKILNTACAIITGLFITSASALAQTAPPTPAKAAGANYYSGGDTSLALPKAAPSTNFYLDVGPIYTRTKIGDQNHDKSNTNMLGLNVAFGWRVNQYNKIQFDLASLSANSKKDYGPDGKITYGAIPALVSYNICVPLAKNQQCELRLAPMAGYYFLMADCDNYVSRKDGNRWLVDDTRIRGAFAYGGSAGLTYHINRRFYVDFAYRFLEVGSMTINKIDIKSQTTHSAIASFGWKF